MLLWDGQPCATNLHVLSVSGGKSALKEFEFRSQTQNQPQRGLLSVSRAGKEAIYALDGVWGRDYSPTSFFLAFIAILNYYKFCYMINYLSRVT